MKTDYLFTSQRLAFRNWKAEDIKDINLINGDPEVMEYFPKSLNKKESEEFIAKKQNHFSEKAYCYFATELLDSKDLIGMIGFNFKEYKAVFNPCTDIGWRLKKSSWGKGYATEGAKACLDFAFTQLKINRIVSVCTKNNWASEKVMQKIGMIKKGEFQHPELKDYPKLENCVWYEILKKLGT